MLRLYRGIGTRPYRIPPSLFATPSYMPGHIGSNRHSFVIEAIPQDPQNADENS